MEHRGAPLGRIGIVLLMVLFATVTWHAVAAAGQLTLTWVDAAANEVSISIERRVGTTGPYTEIGTTAPGIVTYADTTLADATTYCYRLRAFNEAGYSDYSNTACARTPDMFGLAVLKFGAGSGTVLSTSAGITCGPSCSASYPRGSTVTLSAAAAPGSTFSGWSGGGCSGNAGCTVTMTSSRTVSATFDPGSSTFRDDFERPDSTELGMGWSEARGNFFIGSGKLWNGTGTRRQLAVQTLAPLASGHVTAGFKSKNNDAAPAFGVLFGYVDRLNYYAGYRQVGQNPVLKVVRVVDGFELVLAQRPCSNPVEGERFPVTVTFSPERVVLTTAGQSLTAAGVAVTARPVGIMLTGGGSSHNLDNFEAGR
jgi:hypothetical protein